MSSPRALRETNWPGLIARGKVRDIYDLGERLMIVATDRVSAFDVVMNEPIPAKGVVLTRLSEFWLNTLPACSPHHLDYVVSETRCPSAFEPYRDSLVGRAMVVRKARVLPVECVVRGYLVGGGWKEYQQTGRVSGIELPAGLRLAEPLPAPIFTPSTKAASGHDEPISFEQACEIAGESWMRQARERSLAIYQAAAEHALRRGVILADTKFEFGVAEPMPESGVAKTMPETGRAITPETGRANTPETGSASTPETGAAEELLLVDEALTPDSSRFWPRADWRPGENPPSFDKQFLRDYLETLDWPKTPPPPPIPPEIIEQTARRYREALTLLIN